MASRQKGKEGNNQLRSRTNVYGQTKDAHAHAELADDQFTDAQSVACIVAI